MRRLCCVEECLFGAPAGGEDSLPVSSFGSEEFPEDPPRFPETSRPFSDPCPVGRSHPVIFFCGDAKLLPDIFLGLHGFELSGVLGRLGLRAGADFVPEFRYVFQLDGRGL